MLPRTNKMMAGRQFALVRNFGSTPWSTLHCVVGLSFWIGLPTQADFEAAPAGPQLWKYNPAKCKGVLCGPSLWCRNRNISRGSSQLWVTESAWGPEGFTAFFWCFKFSNETIFRLPGCFWHWWWCCSEYGVIPINYVLSILFFRQFFGFLSRNFMNSLKYYSFSNFIISLASSSSIDWKIDAFSHLSIWGLWLPASWRCSAFCSLSIQCLNITAEPGRNTTLKIRNVHFYRGFLNHLVWWSGYVRGLHL